MSAEKSIEEAIQKLAGTYLKDIVQIFLCTVDSVDFDNRQCDCTPIGSDSETSLPGVLLCAENNNGLVVSPKVGSTVIVALSTRNTAFVLMYSDIDSVQFMDGTFGGLVKIQNLKTQYDNNILAIKTAVLAALALVDTQLAVLGQPGGTSAAFTSSATSILNLNLATLENKLITHGDI